MTLNRILVVDDEAMVLESVRMTLAHYGYNVDTATSGGQALTKLASLDYALVVTDLRMPVMTGDQLALEIKKQWPCLPVVLLTGFPPVRKPPGVDIVLLKPFSSADLQSTVHALTTDRSQVPPAKS